MDCKACSAAAFPTMVNSRRPTVVVGRALLHPSTVPPRMVTIVLHKPGILTGPGLRATAFLLQNSRPTSVSLLIPVAKHLFSYLLLLRPPSYFLQVFLVSCLWCPSTLFPCPGKPQPKSISENSADLTHQSLSCSL